MPMRPRWDSKNKRWEASLGSGKNRVWFRSKVEGEDGRAIVEAKVKRFVEGPEELPPGSLAEFTENVWWPVVKQDTTYATRIGYSSVIANHFGTLNPMTLPQLRLEVLQPWAASLATYTKTDKDGNVTHHVRSPKTIRNIVGVLTSILDMAHKMGRMPHLDYKLVRLPKKVARDPVSLTAEQVEKLLYAASGSFMEGCIWAASHLGLRRNEVCGLKRGHVEILKDRAIVRIQDNRQRHGEEARLKSKNPGEARVLVVPKEWGEKLLAFANPGMIYVFSGGTGNPVNPNKITRRMPELCEAAAVPHVSFHSLRHSCSSNLRAAGVPETMIQTILGHSSIDTTLIYLDKRADEQLQAFLKLRTAD